MSKKMVWTVTGLALLIILLIVLKKAGLLGEDEAVKATAEKLEIRTIIETVNASGKIYPEIEVKVSPDISGEITELDVKEGDSVRRGAVLAKIYADIYTTQRDQAAAVVHQQMAAVENNRAMLLSLQSALELAQVTFDRQKQLLSEKVISQAEFEQAQNTLRNAQASYNAAVQGIKGGQASVASAQANLEKANKDLSRTAVLAPMDGVISLLSVKKGERVVGNSMMAGTEMMRIADMSVLEARVDVGENDIPKVHLGDSALVEVDAYPNRKFRGVVTQIASSSVLASQTVTTTTSDVTNYKVYIRLLPESYRDLINPERPRNFPFRPGMSASADIQTKTKDNAIAVPINAVTTREKGEGGAPDTKDDSRIEEGLQETDRSGLSADLDEVVFTVQPDGTVKKRVVATGIQDINYIEVTRGADTSMSVITAPYNVISKTLKDGMKVKIVPKDKLFAPAKK
ncbi:MAG TPA: efflux RND transporter periplasmic adaptor subunit [Flavitalea sp.]|nr:efflux RND transporter periplasmic adaptor subunit [Flavitalea sp.]